jgi:hypothetical protein
LSTIINKGRFEKQDIKRTKGGNAMFPHIAFFSEKILQLNFLRTGKTTGNFQIILNPN